MATETTSETQDRIVQKVGSALTVGVGIGAFIFGIAMGIAVEPLGINIIGLAGITAGVIIQPLVMEVLDADPTPKALVDGCAGGFLSALLVNLISHGEAAMLAMLSLWVTVALLLLYALFKVYIQ